MDTNTSVLLNQAMSEMQRSHQAASHASKSDLVPRKAEFATLLRPIFHFIQPLPVTARLTTSAVVCAWFGCNIGLLLMNRYLLSNYGFRQPIFLTLCHMLACVVLSTAFDSTNCIASQRISSSRQLIKISVLAIVFAMAVVLGNVALRFIPVSFSQVCTQNNRDCNCSIIKCAKCHCVIKCLQLSGCIVRCKMPLRPSSACDLLAGICCDC